MAPTALWPFKKCPTAIQMATVAITNSHNRWLQILCIFPTIFHVFKLCICPNAAPMLINPLRAIDTYMHQRNKLDYYALLCHLSPYKPEITVTLFSILCQIF